MNNFEMKSDILKLPQKLASAHWVEGHKITIKHQADKLCNSKQTSYMLDVANTGIIPIYVRMYVHICGAAVIWPQKTRKLRARISPSCKWKDSGLKPQDGRENFVSANVTWKSLSWWKMLNRDGNPQAAETHLQLWQLLLADANATHGSSLRQ